MVKQWTQILACKTQVFRGKTWTSESHPCLFDWVGEYLLTWVLGLTQKVDFNSCSRISKESCCQVAKVEDHWWILYPNFVWRLSNNNFNTGRKKKQIVESVLLCAHSILGQCSLFVWNSDVCTCLIYAHPDKWHAKYAERRVSPTDHYTFQEG